MERRIWVVPENDGEGAEILRLLRERGERVLRSGLPWGATWAGLEQEIQTELSRLSAGEIYGVELGGENPYRAVNIDHHWYSAEDRSHDLSSLEQVAAILGVKLDRRQQLIAANDKGYIPAMLAMGATPDEIRETRTLDRRAQGIGPADEARAAAEVQRADMRDGRAWVECVERPNAYHSDLLFGKVEEWMLASSEEWLYSGPRHSEFGKMRLPEKHWSGGARRSGYFGVVQPGEQTRERMRGYFWNNVLTVR